MKKLSILGVCAGNGVILHPFLQAKGFRILGNLEGRAIFSSPNQDQWKANFGDLPFYRKLNEIPPDIDKPDIILGHPDCGNSSQLSFSKAKKLSNPKDNVSHKAYWDAVQFYKPKIWVMENLPKMLHYLPLEEIRANLPDYNIVVLNPFRMWDLGSSQPNRTRLIIIGVLKPYSKVIPYLLRVSLVSSRYLTKELLIGLEQEIPSLAHVWEPIDKVIAIYGGKKLSLRVIQHFWLNDKRNGSRWRIYGNPKMKTAPGVYRNLSNLPPNTVRKGNREFNPQGLMMSPRERARIQSIPDTFNIYYHSSRSLYWINKGRVTVTKTPPYQFSLWLYRNLLACINKNLF